MFGVFWVWKKEVFLEDFQKIKIVFFLQTLWFVLIVYDTFFSKSGYLTPKLCWSYRLKYLFGISLPSKPFSLLLQDFVNRIKPSQKKQEKNLSEFHKTEFKLKYSNLKFWNWNLQNWNLQNRNLQNWNIFKISSSFSILPWLINVL